MSELTPKQKLQRAIELQEKIEREDAEYRRLEHSIADDSSELRQIAQAFPPNTPLQVDGKWWRFGKVNDLTALLPCKVLSFDDDDCKKRKRKRKVVDL